jgi:hypothetical protein
MVEIAADARERIVRKAGREKSTGRKEQIARVREKTKGHNSV